jgi:hypothetical protein
MRQLLAGCLLCVLFAVGCGSDEPESSEDRVEVFRSFARAAEEQDGDRLWELISERMKAQISREEFTAPPVLRNLRADYGPLAAGSVALDAEVDGDAAVVALRGEGAGPGAEAAILRRERGAWRVQLTEIDLGYGGDLTFGVNARREDRAAIEARAWVDGQEAGVSRTEGAFEPMFRIVPRRRLAEGPHSVVSYVEAGKRFGAIAWTFER